MNSDNIWLRAKKLDIKTGEKIVGKFDIGFDKKIPDDVKAQLREFVRWVEVNFYMPITLWVDFEYRHYLIRRDGKRVGYLFFWADFENYPCFDNVDDIPIIRLPVRTEHSTMEEILFSFIQAITDYYAWLCNEINDDFTIDTNDEDCEEILQVYLNRGADENVRPAGELS